MKFKGNPAATSVHRDLPNVDIEWFIRILRSVAPDVGEETREKMREAIKAPRKDDLGDNVIRFWNTPIYGYYYVYLWFDADGELFYIGKGSFGRADDIRGRSDEFRARAEGGHYEILASNLNEAYALDLEKILILEALRSGKQLLNRATGDGADAIRYCSGDRDYLLWYWDRLGVIARYSELTNSEVYYDARVFSEDALDERVWWWDWSKKHNLVNDPKILAEINKAEEKKRMQREKAREYRRKRLAKTAV